MTRCMSCVVDHAEEGLSLSTIFFASVCFWPAIWPEPPTLFNEETSERVSWKPIPKAPPFECALRESRPLGDILPSQPVSIFHGVESRSYHFTATHFADLTSGQVGKQVRLFKFHGLTTGPKIDESTSCARGGNVRSRRTCNTSKLHCGWIGKTRNRLR